MRMQGEPRLAFFAPFRRDGLLNGNCRRFRTQILLRDLHKYKKIDIYNNLQLVGASFAKGLIT